MAKIILILLVAAVLENIGVVYVKAGLNQIHVSGPISVSMIARMVKAGATNHNILLGVALQAAFFGCFLYLLSQKDVSLIWPLTSVGFVVGTFAAKFVLDEKVSGVRWAGVILITIGAFLTSYSEQMKLRAQPEAASGSASVRPQ